MIIYNMSLASVRTTHMIYATYRQFVKPFNPHILFKITKLCILPTHADFKASTGDKPVSTCI